MNDLLIGLLGALLATNPPAAANNVVKKATGVSLHLPNPNDPVEKEYKNLLAEDNAAREEVDQWIKADEAFAEKGAGAEGAVLRGRIRQRLDKVKKHYTDFLQRSPNHSRARLAFGSFLMEIQEEEEGREQWEKARELDPTNPAAWNNLANYYGHSSPVAKAFEYYAKAIELDPKESVYYHNFATTVYLFRRDATNYYRISERQVFDRAMALYHKALELDPENFLLASDVAQSYYGYHWLPKADDEASRRRAERELADKAIAAWMLALKLARDDIERQGVYLHLARNQINARRFDEAQRQLAAVTNQMFNVTKNDLSKKLARLQATE